RSRGRSPFGPTRSPARTNSRAKLQAPARDRPETRSVSRHRDRERTAVHVRRRLDAEEAQRGRRDIDDMRFLRVDRSVAEEHAWHEPRIDAVIAAPRLDVVLEHGPGDDAGRAVPRRAVAGVVADDQIGAVFEVRTRVQLRWIERVAD